MISTKAVKQILQNLSTGATYLAEVPRPTIRTGCVLVRTEVSLVSIGTERMLIEFGRAGLLEKARKQPEKVQQVFAKVKSDGVFSTLSAVRAKLDQPVPLGYSNAGFVIESAVPELRPGDRVVSNGPHAEVVLVPKNLCAKIPDGVTSEHASFTVVGSIALQSIRLLAPNIGERIVVVGLGLIGLLAVQLLRANGCQVLGVDLDSGRCEEGRHCGIEVVDLSTGADPVTAASAFSCGNGVDGVIITASAKSNEPIHQAAQMCRKRGRIVLVGVVGMQLSRSDFYEKELSFQVSCSYGPGRYDDAYERLGLDYPIGFVRWTEQRNFEAVLRLMCDQLLKVDHLISDKVRIQDAIEAYKTEKLRNALGILIEYPGARSSDDRALVTNISLKDARRGPSMPTAGAVRVGLIGAGNYTNQTFLPALTRTNAELLSIASSNGVSASHLGEKARFLNVCTDASKIIEDPAISAVLITTRHSSHAQYVIAALKAGKDVFVEKPLCLNRGELEAICSAYEDAYSARKDPPILMVGFNRRFSPHGIRAKSLLEVISGPKAFVMTVNAGAISSTHWTQQKSEGGRIIGEACHFIDFLRFLAGSAIRNVTTTWMGREAANGDLQDNAIICISFADGSVGTIHYLSNGHKSFQKERLQIFCGGRVLDLNNFRVLEAFGWPNFGRKRLWRQDKGHGAEVAAFIRACSKRLTAPIPFAEIVEVTKATFDAASTQDESYACS